MDVTIHHANALTGTLSVPPDKAMCHRAVLLASLANGRTVIRPWPKAEDCQQTRQLVEQLGVATGLSGDGLWVQGRGLTGLRQSTTPLFCGESGTTFRLTAGVLAGQVFTTTLSAGPLLSRRPMQRIVEPLSRMGAELRGQTSLEHPREVYPPLTIHGRYPLQSIRYTLPVASAQVKSAVLLAGLFAKGQTIVVEPAPTRDHTERMLRHFGVSVRCHAGEISITPSELTSPGTIELPGDVSSAAFFIVAASCVPGSHVTLRNIGLNPTRIGWLSVLQRMGASIRIDRRTDDVEPRGDLKVEARTLRGTIVEATEVPNVIDELPILMVAAACASGQTRFQGIGELRVKETDRIQSMVIGLRQLGVTVREPAPDTVEISGGRLVGATVASFGDHRTAMSLAVAGLVAQGTTVIHRAECVAKSFPEFFEQLKHVAGSPTLTVDKAKGLC